MVRSNNYSYESYTTRNNRTFFQSDSNPIPHPTQITNKTGKKQHLTLRKKVASICVKFSVDRGRPPGQRRSHSRTQ